MRVHVCSYGMGWCRPPYNMRNTICIMGWNGLSPKMWRWKHQRVVIIILVRPLNSVNEYSTPKTNLNLELFIDRMKVCFNSFIVKFVEQSLNKLMAKQTKKLSFSHYTEKRNHLVLPEKSTQQRTEREREWYKRSQNNSTTMML